MTPEEIDKIFEAMKKEDNKYLWNIYEMPYEFSGENRKKYKDEYYEKLGKLIEQGDFEYFLTKKNGTIRDKEIFVELLSYTAKVDEIKKCIEERELLGLNSSHVIKLILGTNDLSYIKDCIDYRRKELNLDSYDIEKLILGTKDSSYIKDYIDNRKEDIHFITDLILGTKDSAYIKDYIDNKREELYLNTDQVVKLIIGTEDSAYIKNCIDNRREELHLSIMAIEDLILGTKDQNYIKECIENKRDELYLMPSSLVELIINTNDVDYIKDCIDNRRNELYINNCNISKLILATKDFDYIKNCINNRRDELNIDSYNMIELILGTKDQNYIKNCIDNRRDELNITNYDVSILLKAIEDVNYIKNCIDNRREEFNLHGFIVANLIEKIGDIEYTKKCINKRKELGLDYFDIVNCIRETDDVNFIKECISKKEELGLECGEIINFIKAIDDPNYIKECISKKENLNLEDEQILELITIIRDKKAAKECIKEAEKVKINDSSLNVLKIIYDEDYLNKLLKMSTNAIINLPTEMTIGIEIESVGKNAEIIEKISNKPFRNWECEYDSSVLSSNSKETGIEVVSPILTGENENSSKEIKKVCAILQEVGNYTNDTCGGHIHIGADYLTNVNAWGNLLELWTNTEKILYIIGNETGNIPRNGTIKYARPISRDLEDALSTDSINLDSKSDLEDFKEQILEFQQGRYKGINFQNIKRSKKKTIEFRLPNGTVNSKTWIQNINLFGGIVKAAQELSIIQSKNENELSDEEKKKLICFESIKSDELSEKEKLEALLELLIEESSRGIYTERYEVNNKLLEENPDIQEEIREQISREPIKISKKEIGKKFFTGSDRIVGPEEELTEQIISKDMEKEKIDAKEK